MKIDQCKTHEDINQYFDEADKKLYKELGFVYGEMDRIREYARRRQDILEKCGERLKIINIALKKLEGKKRR
jgi:hypothetical protein